MPLGVHPGPETPALVDTDTFTGHVWVQELPTAGQFRFQVADSGLITFATPDQTYDAASAVPLQFRLAADAIRERLDRQALSAATETPERITFAGLAPRYEGIDYEWPSVPGFVGVDVWSDEADGWLSPDTATTVYDRLALPTLPVVGKELPVSHTDLDQYTSATAFPGSNWRDGPAAGLLFRDKTGTRAQTWHSTVTESDPEIHAEGVDELVTRYAPADHIDRISETVTDGPAEPPVDVIRDRLLAKVARRAAANLYRDGDLVVSRRALESAIAERIQRYRTDR
jgi:hypothetical protein